MRSLLRIGPHPLLLIRYVLHHLERRARLRWLRRSYSTRISRVPAGATLRPPEIVLPTLAELPSSLEPDARRVIAEAEAVLRHEFELLGSGVVGLGDDIDWHRDFKSGYRWPRSFYLDVQATRLDDDSDAKVPWELSRGHQLLTLARAAALTHDERFALELERQLDSWIRENPPGIGINWVNAMEVAIRAVNWLWAVGTLSTWRPLEPALLALTTKALQAHARHIAANLEGTPYLRSNHYLADVLGLYALGTAIEGDPQAARWRRLGRNALEREAQRQVLPDGVGFEASLPYHGLSLEMLLVAAALARQTGEPLSGGFDDRVKAMLTVSAAVRHRHGRTPQFGDGDSGRVLPGGFDRPASQDALLWLGSAVLGSDRPFDGVPHSEVAWTLGVDVWSSWAEQSPATGVASRGFPDGGIYVLRDEVADVVVRCGDVGQNGNGGHAHNDVLSYELSYAEPLVVDSGTYAYTFDPEARNAFRSTRAHNVVVVDGEEINPLVPGQLFRLRQVARPIVDAWEPDNRRLAAGHDGYRRFGVMCRRTLTLQDGRLSVADRLDGCGAHSLESLVHLAPGVQVVRDGASLTLEQLGRAFRLDWWGVDEVSLEDGWISDRYGRRERASVVAGLYSGVLPCALGYSIEPVGIEAALADSCAQAVVA